MVPDQRDRILGYLKQYQDAGTIMFAELRLAPGVSVERGLSPGLKIKLSIHKAEPVGCSAEERFLLSGRLLAEVPAGSPGKRIVYLEGTFEPTTEKEAEWPRWKPTDFWLHDGWFFEDRVTDPHSMWLVIAEIDGQYQRLWIQFVR